jgi:hypothetical protein
MSARNLSGWNWIWKASLSLFFALLIHTATAWAVSVTLTWDPPTTNTDSTPLTALAGYKIYYGLAPGKYITSLNVGNVTQFQVNNLDDAVTHYFAVTAYNTSGYESDYSNVRSIIKLSGQNLQTLPPVLKISGFSQSWYSSIQTACTGALDGDSILAQTTDLYEDLSLNNGLNLSIHGGYAADFSAVTGVTTVHGAMAMIVGPGSVSVHNLVLQFQ